MSIGRAELDAGDLTPAFVHSANELDAVAIDAGHLYWTSFFAHGIERANLDGTAAARLPAGPPGAAGPTGPRGPAGKVGLVTCRPATPTIGQARRRVRRTRTVRLVSGPVKLTARLSRAGRTLAAASGRPRHGRLTLTVTAMRRLAPGRYRLTVTAGAGGSRTRSSRSVTVR